jgi:hypothetical protein
MTGALKWLVDVAGSVNDTRFRMIVGSSSVGTAVIVASALAGNPELPGAAGLLAQALAPAPQTASAPPAAAPSTPAPVQQAGLGPSPASTFSGTPSSTVTTPTDTEPTDTEPEVPDRLPGRVKNVFVIALSSPGYEQSFGTATEMPYLANTLRPQGQLLSNYTLLSAKGLPNYIAMIGGQRPNAQTSQDCPSYNLFPPTATTDKNGYVPGDGCLYPLQATTLADQLHAENLKWGGFMEDMANPDSPDPNTPPTAPARPTCVRPQVTKPDPTQHSRTGNGYAIRHNPFVYYRSLTDLGGCGENVLALDKLEPELLNGNITRSFNYIVPNLCHSGSEKPCIDQSPGGAEAADDWLETWVPKIQTTSAFKNGGLIVITFGESMLPAPGPNERVGTLLINRWLTPGSELATPQNPYSMLKTFEDLFGLNYLAGANAKSTSSFSSQLLGVKKTKKKKKKKKK